VTGPTTTTASAGCLFLIPQNSQRPPKERALIKEVPKKHLMTCEEHEWNVFNENVEKVKAAAEKHFEEREPPWIAKVLLFIASGIGGDDKEDPTHSAADRSKDLFPDMINIMARNKEIEEGTKQAAEDRARAIKKNCKKP